MANVIYYAAHQDDETVIFGPSAIIHSTSANGHNVKVVILTDGSSSYVRDLLNGSASCGIHGKVHSPVTDNYGVQKVGSVFSAKVAIDEANFTYARNTEFLRACEALGVDEVYVHKTLVSNYKRKSGLGMDIPVVDGALTKDAAKDVIRYFETKFPGASHKSQSFKDAHNDHNVIGKALDELYIAGEVSDARFYVKPGEWSKFLSDSTITVYRESLTTAQKAMLTKAMDEYGVWNPEANRYAIGKHSSGAFEIMEADPRGMWHKSSIEQ